MKKITLGRTGLEVTRWGLGGIPLSTIMGGTTEDVIEEIIHTALDYGINFIDTSRVYMDSETNLGQAIQSRRNEVIIASKSYSRTRDEVLADVEESLNQLHTDQLDIYQVHALYPNEVTAFMGSGGGMEGFIKAKEDGMIKHIGLTSHHNSVLLDLVKTGYFDTVMFPFNVIERDAEKELIQLAKALNIGMLVMKPLAGGAIRNRSKAFRFFNNFPVDVILNGVASVAEFKENIQWAEDENPLTAEELTALEAEVASLGNEFCRRCSYCMPCPNDIRIPDMIHIFYQAVKGMRFEELPPDKQEVGKNLLVWLQACEQCGKCEQKCPYNLPTGKRVQELISLFTQQP
jgi:predicted aldo/keto reductase-like oxidoreductase